MAAFLGVNMHILMINDDGVMAPGLRELANYLAKSYKVTVVAPEVEQSAKSHAITTGTPIYLHSLIEAPANPSIYAITGTPVDCAKFALSYLLEKDRPDLLISGINNGFNLGSDSIYSGTVGGAMEGLFYNVPALAVSVEKYSSERGKELFPFIKEFIQKFFQDHEYQGLLNMNFPLQGEVSWNTLRLAKQGYQKYINIFDRCETKRGKEYFWLGGDLVHDHESPDTDVRLIKEGYTTLVPLQWSQESSHGMARAKKIIEDRK